MAEERAARRARSLWGVLDQGVSSLVTLALTIAVARGADPREFGFFSLVLMVSTIVQSLNRAATSDPLTIRFSARGADEVRSAAKSSLAASAILGVGLGGAMAFVGLVLGSSVGAALLVFGVSAPFVAVQEGCRMAFLAMRRSRATLSIDLVWLAVVFGGAAALTASGHISMVTITAIWGLGAALSSLIALRWLSVRPAATGARTWLRSNRDLSSPLVVDQVTMLAGSQATVWAVGVIVGVAGLGALRVVQAAFGPLTTVFTAVSLVAVPELVRVARDSPDRAVVVAWRLSAAMALLAAGAGFAVWLMPSDLGRALFGESWHLASDITIPMSLALAATGAQTGWIVAAKALELGRGIVRARSVTTVLVASFGVTGAALGGLQGAVGGMAAGGWIGVACWRHEVVRRAPAAKDVLGTGNADSARSPTAVPSAGVEAARPPF